MPHSREVVFQELREIARSQLEVREEEITEEAKFKENLGADSLDVVEMIMAIEDHYKISIPDDDLNKDEDMTFGQLVDYVFEKLNE